MKKEFNDRVEHRNEKWMLHNEDGPAVIWRDGDKFWWINGQLHRLDGPAIEFSSGEKHWYLNGIRYSEERYQEELIKIKLERLTKL